MVRAQYVRRERATEESSLNQERDLMKERLEAAVRRRDLLYAAIAGAGAAVTNAVATEPAHAKPVDLVDKRRARYQATSAEVQNFYRVVAYPAK
jgi:hypothetical protein